MKVTEGPLDTFPAARFIMQRLQVGPEKTESTPPNSEKAPEVQQPICPALREAISSTLMRLYNDQRNAQVLSLFIYFLVTCMFRAFC
jgi:hypothetical protein